ncbi:hypothetical protein AYI69_g8464 [Smittium culicis]|uniref:Uncharacterized protein n=1 Tax=Smittium culicis TaxID=133412 RepID=A0A1R1XJE9_9FUNG|nr:hypothetical protein AYI69_g8464 [Smittium culicis]
MVCVHFKKKNTRPAVTLVPSTLNPADFSSQTCGPHEVEIFVPRSTRRMYIFQLVLGQGVSRREFPNSQTVKME